MTIDPTGLEQRRARVRPVDHLEQGHGAATDHEALEAYRKAIAARRAASRSTALLVGPRRHYSEDEQRRAQILLDEAASLRKIAAAKIEDAHRRFVEREAEAMERSADEVVPREFRRTR